MGLQAKRCVKPGEVRDSLEWLINTDGPALLEVVTDKKVGLFPMVPAGKGLHEMIIYDAGEISKPSVTLYKIDTRAEKDKADHATRISKAGPASKIKSLLQRV